MHVRLYIAHTSMTDSYGVMTHRCFAFEVNGTQVGIWLSPKSTAPSSTKERRKGALRTESLRDELLSAKAL